jgi:hypothetical protein
VISSTSRPAARLEHAPEFGGGRGEVGDVAQRVAHHQEVRAGRGHRDLLGPADAAFHRLRELRLLHHPRAGVDADQALRLSRDLQDLLRHEARAHADVDDLHARLQAGAQQRLPPVPGTRAQAEDLFQPVVVHGRAVEGLAQEGLARGGIAAAVVRGQGSVRKVDRGLGSLLA